LKRLSPAARTIVEFAFAFACVFGGLALPSPGIGPAYTRAHAALGNALLHGASFERGATLHFEAADADLAAHPWQLTLRVLDPARIERPVLVPMDLRTLLYLPLVAFVALSLAAPLGSPWRNARVLGQGWLILTPTLLALTALPLLSFLGGTGPVRVFRLAPWLHVLFQTVYRALVAPPGMMYALPLLLWWALVARLEPRRVAGSAAPTLA
jgi:hypothetical protein